MADPSIMDFGLSAIEKAGIAVVTILGLLGILKWLSQTHLKALNVRLDVLEKVVKARDEIIATRDAQLNAAHKAMLDRADKHSAAMHEMASLVMAEMAATRRASVQAHAVISRLLDALAVRPCLKDPQHHPTPVPSAKDMPEARNEEPTAKEFCHA